MPTGALSEHVSTPYTFPAIIDLIKKLHYVDDTGAASRPNIGLKWQAPHLEAAAWGIRWWGLC